MKLNHGLHLAYCTNVHRGETWPETFAALKTCTLAVKARVSAAKPFAIGLRLSHQAATELKDPATMRDFRKWLAQNQCYVFTINGFPYGRFHGERVKERVYLPDWTCSDRLDYTNLLFDLLAQLLPENVEGSISTVPGGFKELVTTPEEGKVIRDHLWHCVEHVARLGAQTGRKLHLGLEPEPLCLLECSGETIHFFDRMRAEHPRDPRLAEHLGVNYDTCHFAVEFEEPEAALECLRQHNIRISKIHLSSALKVRPTAEVREALTAFAEDVYLHQVVVRRADGQRTIYRDLPQALAREPLLAESEDPTNAEEWRIHFHIPLHSPPLPLFDTTIGHLVGTLDWLQADPARCSHLEMETYTWEVLPPEFKSRDVVDQLASEYEWTLARLTERGLA
jgi:sugar phosphate isomerase/epimerase